MRNKDVIFTSNAATVEATKFLSYIRLVIATADDPIKAAISAYTLKGLVQGTTAASTTIVTTPAPIVTGR